MRSPPPLAIPFALWRGEVIVERIDCKEVLWRLYLEVEVEVGVGVIFVVSYVEIEVVLRGGVVVVVVEGEGRVFMPPLGGEGRVGGILDVGVTPTQGEERRAEGQEYGEILALHRVFKILLS